MYCTALTADSYGGRTQTTLTCKKGNFGDFSKLLVVISLRQEIDPVVEILISIA